MQTGMSPYEVSVLPQGSINARQATAADFGGGPGLENIANSLGTAGERILQVQNDQANVWASTAAAQQEVNIRQQWNQHVNSLDPTAPDYGEKLGNLSTDATQLWGDSVDEVVSKAPSARAANFVREHMARAQVAFTGQVLAQQAGLNADFTKSLVQQDVSTRSDSIVAAGGSNESYQANLAASQATIGNLKSISPEAKQAMLDWTRHSYALAQATTVATQNPGVFLASVDPQGGIQPTPSAAPSTALTPDGTASQALVKSIIIQESGGNAHAVSGKGAGGLMGLMPATATSVGVQDVFDPAQNVAGGTAYINKMLAQFKDPQLALAAYNAGPGRVAELVAKYGNSFDAIAPHLPTETRNYVPSVLSRIGGSAAATPGLPQVQPLSEKQVMNAHPDVAGWDSLTFPEKMQMVRMAESKQGKALATARADLKARIADANALHMNGQSAPADSQADINEANLVAHFGPVEGPRMWQDYSATKQFASTMAGMATMPTAQLDQQLMAEKPTGADAAQLLPRWNQMAAAARATQKAQQKQWTDYAMAHGIGNAQPLDPKNDQTFLAGLADRQKLMQTGRQEYGVTKPTIFSSSEVQAIGNRLDTMNPTDRINFLVNMGRGLSDPTALQTAFNQIAPGREGLVSAARIALHPGSVTVADGVTQTGYEVGRMVAQGDYILHGGMKKAGHPGNADAPQPNGKGALGLNTSAFKQSFDQAVGGLSAFRGDNAAYGSKVQSQLMTAAMDYYVADAYQRGLDVSNPDDDDVQRAVNAVTGGVAKVQGASLFVPYGMDADAFRDQFRARALQTLTAAGYDADDAAATLGQLVPVNLKDGQYGFMNGTKLMLNKSGTAPVIVDYSQPAPPAQASWWQKIMGVQVGSPSMSAVQMIGK
jgi:soluble lytic murein transglycosylase-like protein